MLFQCHVHIVSLHGYCGCFIEKEQYGNADTGDLWENEGCDLDT